MSSAQLEQVQRLRQSRVWVDGTGRAHDVRHMGRRHAANVVAFLERGAPALHMAAYIEAAGLPEPNGSIAADEWDDELYRMLNADPVEWLHEQRLVRALVERAAGHRGGQSLRWRLTHLSRRGGA